MAEFKVVVADPETGETVQREVDGQDANRFLGRELGDEIGGDAVGLEGFTIEITGGSDETGRPMRTDVSGTRLKELLLEGGVGFKPSRDGERKRITVRGREIADDVAQINVSVVDGEGDVASALAGDEE
ncbi:30S ribosomal protein S6e [Halorubrum sp. DTA98]|uniref:30S ribosomal protein S6e n=1 Tax=Halorubrum sp. DTA98 TaxID=3402163 RepID=UPI003AAF462E